MPSSQMQQHASTSVNPLHQPRNEFQPSAASASLRQNLSMKQLKKIQTKQMLAKRSKTRFETNADISLPSSADRNANN